MGLSQSYLSQPAYGYDMVVSVTQKGLNNAIQTYYNDTHTFSAVSFYFTKNTDGTPLQVDQSAITNQTGGLDPLSGTAKIPLTQDQINTIKTSNLWFAFSIYIGNPVKDILGHGEDDTGMTPLNIVGSIAATVGAIVVDLAIIVKSQIPYEPAPWTPDPPDVFKNKLFSVIQTVGYMGYILPDMIDGVTQGGLSAYTLDTWFEGMNNLCTYMAVVKSVVDGASAFFVWGDPWGQKYSPAFDFFLNVAWQIPTVFQLLHDLKEHDKFVPADINAIVECIGGTAFDLSGVLSPVYAYSYYIMPPGEDRNAELLVAALGISACNLVWGGSCLATTFDGLPVPS